jgi:hypothetical protein
MLHKMCLLWVPSIQLVNYVVPVMHFPLPSVTFCLIFFKLKGRVADATDVAQA